MKLMKQPTTLILLALLFAPALLFCQEQPAAKEKPAAKEETAAKEESPQNGSVEFGVRHVWGDVYGRPDLPFTPDVLTSKFNEYGDRRNGFVVRKLQLGYDNIIGTKNYVSLQSQSTLYKNQSYLATLGQYGKFKIQFRYDEIPHLYTNTARSLYVQTSPGVFTILPATKQVLQDRSSIVCATAPCTSARLNLSLPGFIASQIVPGENFITPAIQRKAATGLVSWNITPHWNATFLFSREHQSGTRPIGLILNSSPTVSAGLTSGISQLLVNQQSPGTGAELPEPINYFNNTVKAMIEYGKKDWGVQVGYTGSFFQNNVNALVFDNPFATADVAVKTFAPGASGCPAGTARCTMGAVPSRGQVDLYPDNQAHYVNAAAAFDVGKHVRVMGTVTPGWLRQNDPFLPYSANSQIFFPDGTGALTIPATSLSLLPAPSLNGQKQTLAMNYKAVYTPLKDVEVNLSYRQYDYNNNTAILTLTPILGDTIGANRAANAQLTPGDPAATSGSGSTQDTTARTTGFNKKNLELTGDWFFTKRSSLKAGYEGEWFDRSRRDAAHSFENSFFGALDLVPHKDLLIRFSGRHQNRKPDQYEDEASGGVECDATALSAASAAGIFPEVHPCGRRFDEAARLLDRVDALVEYSRDKLTVSGGFQTIQQDFNRRGVGSNSTTPLNFPPGTATTKPYFLYGAMNDLSYSYTFDASYAFSPEVSLFAEYAHERYHKRMISRNRSPFATSAPFCSAGGCDSANNDWESTYRDIFDTYSAGVDLFLGKKAYLTTYYSLAAGKGNIFSRFLGDPTRLTAGDPDKFVLVGASAGVSYPESVTRMHEVTAVFKYKLTERLMPKLEYRFQQFDNRDYQTSAMTPYMGCVSPIPNGPPVTNSVIGCPAQQLIVINSTDPNPTFTPSSFYPGFVVGDTSAARYLFMGVDQPSYRVHTLTATLEYRF
jgi:MtrB/PioB family decaheme-associated outer membrane protein